MRYKAVFIDIDDTVLDYVPCCREAFDAAMAALPAERSVSCQRSGLFELFFSISGRLFSEAKHGLHTIAEVMELYPAEFIERSGLAQGLSAEEQAALTETFKHAFRAAWGETHTLVPQAKETLDTLRRRGYPLFAASNSFGHLQRNRLKRASVLTCFEDTFISMDVGYDKPDIRFFNHALNAVSKRLSQALAPTEVLMVGDSMTTDILGAQAAGWDTCFFNRRPAEAPAEMPADFEIFDLTELLNILP